jgi:membrane-bound lytic murein transglycosylase MltF
MTRLVAFIATTAFALHVQPVDALRNALLTRIRVGHTYIAHCRRAKGGCEQRVNELAVLLTHAAERYELDPYLLAALAIRESGLNPDAKGAVGELGLMQLHPYSAPGVRARWVCKRAPRDCTRAVVFEAAAHLRTQLRRCGGLEYALTAYNCGTCGSSDYARRVVREWEALR